MNNVGSVCSKQRHLNKPKKANLTKTPLKKIEKFVDASTWALGNQPQNGQIGNLTPNPIIQHKNRKFVSKLVN